MLRAFHCKNFNPYSIGSINMNINHHCHTIIIILYTIYMAWEFYDQLSSLSYTSKIGDVTLTLYFPHIFPIFWRLYYTLFWPYSHPIFSFFTNQTKRVVLTIERLLLFFFFCAPFFFPFLFLFRMPSFFSLSLFFGLAAYNSPFFYALPHTQILVPYP